MVAGWNYSEHLFIIWELDSGVTLPIGILRPPPPPPGLQVTSEKGELSHQLTLSVWRRVTMPQGNTNSGRRREVEMKYEGKMVGIVKQKEQRPIVEHVHWCSLFLQNSLLISVVAAPKVLSIFHTEVSGKFRLWRLNLSNISLNFGKNLNFQYFGKNENIEECSILRNFSTNF